MHQPEPPKLQLRHILLIALLGIAVRSVNLYEIQESPFFRYPAGAATLFAGETPRTDVGLDHPLTQSPGYTLLLAAALRATDGDPFPIYVLQVALGTAVCLLLYGLVAALFSSPALGLASGIAAALYGPAIYFGAELTPTLWSALLQLLFLLSVARPPCRGSVCRGMISIILLSAALVESLPARNLPDFNSLDAGNLYLLVQGREWLPDLDPYQARGDSFVIGALLWDKWLAFPFGIVLPLAVFGLFRFRHSTGGQAPGGKALLVFILLSTLTFGLLAPDARHRLPLALLMLPFALLALADGALVDRWKTKTAALVFLLVAANVGFAAPRREPVSAHHFYWTGESYARQGMPANAIDAYHRALEWSPTHHPATRELAALYVEMEKPSEALAVCAAYLRDHPGSPEILLLQGDAYAAAGRLDEALAAYQEVRRSSGEPALGLLVRLGEAYRTTGQIDRAAETYGEALAANPHSSGLRYRLARLYELGGRTAKAVVEYQMLLAKHPSNPEFHARLGGLLFDGAPGDSLFDPGSAAVAEAEDHLDEATSLRNDHLPARRLLVRLLGRQGRYLEAIAQLERLLELAPEDHELHYHLGKLNELAGRETEAQHHLDIFARLDRDQKLKSLALKRLEAMVERIAPGSRSRTGYRSSLDSP